jgi:phospholipid/cholesterol/gamma-HCH transport system permease protein
MSSAATLRTSRNPLGPVAWVGRSAVESLGYVGGVTILLLRVAGTLIWPRKSRREVGVPGFARSLMHQLAWMLFTGIPMVGLAHFAMGSFLALQAYYGSTFVDGTGAVVGVGLLRNLGGIMSGLIFAGILAARMIPELRMLNRHVSLEEPEIPAEPAPLSSATRRGSRDASNGEPPPAIVFSVNRLAAPRVAAAAIAGVLLSLWGITVGTVVGWKAAESLMGLSTEMFFMMMLKMMWFRDVTSLIAKGVLFGALPAAICCFEGLCGSPGDDDRHAALRHMNASHGLAPPCSVPVFRAACLSMVAILIMNSSWFILVYHAVPFYGPTLLPQP